MPSLRINTTGSQWAGSDARAATKCDNWCSALVGGSEPLLHLRVPWVFLPRSPSVEQMETEMITSDREVITPVDVALDDYWFPRVVGQVNDQLIKVAKLKGENVWHKHDDEDEMFLIVSGSLMIEYEDRTVALKAGDLHGGPRGVMHNPSADEECRIVLIEPASTKHTGDVISEKTRSLQEQMG